ncbi:hypothetical protein [Brenneria corticis]|uniref:Carboxymuconolactone decarboxylase family protein n=1 Tax=Brenneria corticis TaxID=2173106 RepID=A0A2U1UCV9_9GAMM|nr:hypothetical protein [Brenneria sp. CFCC 11842]PWC19501.1 hypothetical protein DDT56_00540 [Brenneria sp. CFCC 11842]
MAETLIDLVSYEKLNFAQKSTYYSKLARDGRVTNMQRTLLHSITSFDTFMRSYNLRDFLVPIFGRRAIWIFAHTISEGTDCLICSTFFRRLLIDAGISPDSYEPTEDEKHLQSLARAFLNNGHGVDKESWAALKDKYNDEILTALISYGTMVIANNLFNNIVNPPLDEYLYDYTKP